MPLFGGKKKQEQPQFPPIPPEIRVYLDGLLTSSGIVSVDRVMRESMIQELYVRLDKFLTLKMLDHLPTEKLEEFANLTGRNPSEQVVQAYIQKNVPNAQQMFITAFAEFRDLYLTGKQPKPKGT